MAHVSEAKKKTVQEYVDLINKYKIIGAVNMEGLPAPQLQKMRLVLQDTVFLKMSKRRLLKIALEQCQENKKGIEKLAEYLQGMPALLFTNENPFKLFKILKKNKSNAPAKGGQKAPNDIEVKAGPTAFAPGPIISELGEVGIKCGVENGKIAIKEDSIVAKRDEVISPKLAEILTRLGVEPMEVGLDLIATYEDGVIFNKDVLDVDEEEFINKLQNASRWAFNLSVESAYPTKDNISTLISKSFTDSKGLALETNFLADAVTEELLSKAERQMNSLKDTANIEVVEKAKTEEVAPKEEKAEEPVKEEVAETPKEEKAEEPVKEEVAEAPKEEEIIKKAEEQAEKDPKVVESKEEIKKDEEVLEKDMQKDIDNAKTVEEKEKLEESKEVIEKVIESEVPKAENLLKEKPKEPEKVPSAYDLMKEKEKKNLQS